MSEETSQRILVIDDDTTQRILVKEYLEEAGYTVRLSDDGSRGLKMASRITPDLIILDWMLPSIDGYTLCLSLKQNEATAHIPIILITASRERDVIEKGLSAGADDFVTKPVDWVFLADRVANVLEKSRQQAAITRQLQNAQQIEVDVARKLDQQSQQTRLELDDKIRRIELEAQQEIEAAKVSAQDEIKSAEQRYESQLARLTEEHEKRLLEVEAAALEEFKHSEEAFAAKISELEAEVGRRENAAKSVAEADRQSQKDALKTLYDGKSETCWNFAFAASNHHRDLAFRIMDQVRSSIAQLEALTAGHRLAGELEEVHESARSLADSIAALNLLSQVMSGQAELKEKVFDLGQLLRDAVSRFKKTGEERRIAVDARVPDRPLLVKADEARLTYAIASLLINSIRFTPPGGSITLALAEEADGSLKVEVADTGTGIAPAQLESLRNCLDQPWTSSMGQGNGVGYGIPVATALSRQHGGRLAISSGQGKGTSVAIVLPNSRRQDIQDSSNNSRFRNAS